MKDMTVEELEDLLSYTKHLALTEKDEDWRTTYQYEIEEIKELLKQRKQTE
jgi:hypothetical protein